jgi:hypothetical protein
VLSEKYKISEFTPFTAKSKEMFKNYQNDFNQSKGYILLIVLAIIASYSVYMYCSENLIMRLDDENALFELSTALFF